MRMLFFLEPVIFQNNPSFFDAHFVWVDYFRSVAHQSGGGLAIVANDDVCNDWRDQYGRRPGVAAYYSLNPFEVLSSFEYKRSEYAKATYDGAPEDTVLIRRLRAIREEFKPDLVVMTVQNALAKQAFVGLPVLHIEQAPIPRLGHPFRTVFDPSGHQTGSLLEVHGERIKALLPKGKKRTQSLRLLDAIKENVVKGAPRAAEAQAALGAIRQQDRVALLVTQPEDAVTYEGAYRNVELENLLYAWAEALPPGWIGVPTYHAGQRLSEAMESSLAQACPRLRFLPGDLAQGMTEVLLLEADGMVTISSTSAMTGLLFGKPVVVTGRSPYNTWCLRDPAKIAEAKPLTPAEAASTLCFLTHRYARDHDSLYDNGAGLTETIKAVLSLDNPSEWFLDVADWSLDRAEVLFRLDPPLTPEAETRLASHKSRLEDDLAQALSQRDVYENEWKAAVADRDRLLGELAAAKHDQLEHDLGVEHGRLAVLENSAHALTERLAFMEKAEAQAAAERDVYRQELSASLVHRESLQKDLMALTAQIAVLNDHCEAAKASISAFQAERNELIGHRTQLQAERIELIGHRTQLQTQWSELSVRHERLQTERNELIDHRTQLQTQWSELSVRHERLQAEAARVSTGLEQARARQQVLEEQLAQYRDWAAGCREVVERSRGGRLVSALRWAGLGLDLPPSPPD